MCQPPQLTFRAHERCEAELKLISLSDATLLYKIQTRHRDEFRFKPAVARLGARETACVKVTRVRSAGGGGRLDEFRVLLAGGGVGDTKGVESVEDVEELWISMPRDKIFSIVVGLRIMEAEEEGEKKSEALGVGKEGGILRRCSCLGGYL